MVWLLQKRVVEELRKVLTKDDAPAAARAVLNDAGTYDVATGTGGFNGSLRFECVCPAELTRCRAVVH
jgi:hypothetical protein